MAKKKKTAASSKPSPRRKTIPKRASSSVKPQPGEVVPSGEQANALGFPIVGIGASAGGLNAFKRFFTALPVHSGMAFVLIPHLDPTHQSLMVELLAKYTTEPVVEATEGMAVKPNHVYILPPNKYMTIREGTLRLTGPVERRGVQTSIDVFLRSLAEDQQERAICVILSGTGAHGTLGLKAIKASGGMAMVQEPKSAEFDRMPLSAIDTGLADYILPPENMPAALIKFVQHFDVNGGVRTDVPGESSDELTRILALLRARTKYDFRCYRNRMLRRRIERRMGLHQIEQMSAYLNLLREHPEEIKQLSRDLLISVTSFFRDAEAYHILESQVLPTLIQAKDNEAPLRVWISGCATGEEAYSLAMLLIEQLVAAQKSCRLQIFATDVDEDALETARQGVYPESIAADVSPERLARFFTRADDYSYRVNKQLREVVTFASQNLIGDAPFSRLDLISCRNLLIYLEPNIQTKVISLMHFALNEGGYLLLGPSETIGQQVDLFEPVSKKWRVYRRIGPNRPDRVDFPIAAARDQKDLGRRLAESAGTRSTGFAELTQQLLLEDFAPAAVLINRKYEVLFFFGPSMLYLDQPTGEPTRDLMLLARDGLRTRLRAAVHKAITEQQRVSVTGARIKRNSGYVAVHLTVKPVQTPNAAEGLLLVTFADEAMPAASRPTEPVTVDESLVKQLEFELISTREDLQSTIEELESSNEQLKASNEEVMSMNEELQSANEELETSKEELQSLNEELSTVNSQLQDKVEELEQSNNDIANLLSSTDIATVFLDLELRIKQFTPVTTKLLNLIATDVGRPLTDITPKFTDGDLVGDCHEVIRHLAPRETEVRTQDGGWCLRRIMPYRTLDNRIDGVVITFTDVSQMKQAAERMRRLATVLLDSNDALTVHDFDGRITAWNRGAVRMYGYSEAEALGMNILQLAPEEHRQEFRALIERLHRGERVESWETQRVCQDGRILEVWLTVTTLRDEAGQPNAVATTERDISEQIRSREALEKRVRDRTALFEVANKKLQATLTERRRMEDALRENRDRIAAILDTAAEGIITINERAIVDSFNKAAETIFGYAASEVLGQNVKMLMPSPYHEAHDGYLASYLTTGAKKIIGIGREVVGRRKNGSTFPLELAVSELHDGNQRLFTGMIRDISERRALEKELSEVVAEEQRRIGQDLHDSVGQELTGIGLVAASLVDSLAKTSPPDGELAAKIAKGVNRVLAQVRTLSQGLVPVEVDAAGLMTALAELCVRMRDHSGVSFAFSCDRPVPIEDNLTARQFYRIAQEAITNALRHAQPRHIHVTLEEADDHTITLSVQDDGVGIQTQTPAGTGMGLRIMRYRAGLINATLNVTPAGGGGTLVTCTLRKGQ